MTLYATADSITQGALRAVAPRSWSEDETLDPKVWEYLHISQAMEEAGEFDIVHSNFDFMPLTYSRLIKTPMVTTVHGFSIDQYRLVYRKYRDSYFVSISDADRDPILPYVRTVYNGIRLDQFGFRPEPGQYLAFVGRIHPDKGVHHAVQVALTAGIPLVIGAIVQDEAYFRQLIEPSIDGRNVTFLGPVGPDERDELLGNALGSLHLTTIPERFGLAMAESMATGTPVIGFDLGSVREVVSDQETGFVVNTVEEAVAAAGRLGEISRHACRERVERLFSVEAMTDGYEEVYRTVLEGG